VTPTTIAKEYEVPADGPHGLDLDPVKGRLLCACDGGVLVTIDATSGRVLGDVPLSGAPDVIFLDTRSGHLYVAIGEVPLQSRTNASPFCIMLLLSSTAFEHGMIRFCGGNSSRNRPL
jgi:hypothetical protein